MDIRYYFKAVDFSKFREEEYQNNKNSLGCLIEKNMLNFSLENLNTFKLVIIGITSDEKTPNKGTSFAPDKIRNFLYSLDNINPKLKILDFGNLKKGNGKRDIYFAIRDVIDYLKELGLTTIVLGGSQDMSVGIAKAFNDERLFQMSTVDPKIDMKISREPFSSLNYVSKILKDNPNIFHINFIGFQSYFVSGKLISKIKELGFDTFRLGKIRTDMEELEPVLRDTHFLSFDISAVRQQDAPGYYNGSPNGIYSEEACQISRYAGLSNNMIVFGLFEVNTKKDKDFQTTKLAAQIIWYFIDGFDNRKIDHPQKNSSLFIQYNVELEDQDMPIVFYNHKLSKRWWMQLEDFDKNKILIACSEMDYKTAAKKEIPTKWLQFIRKIDLMSK
jgi:arginase family enzyme